MDYGNNNGNVWNAVSIYLFIFVVFDFGMKCDLSKFFESFTQFELIKVSGKVFFFFTLPFISYLTLGYKDSGQLKCPRINISQDFLIWELQPRK